MKYRRLGSEDVAEKPLEALKWLRGGQKGPEIHASLKGSGESRRGL